MVIIATSNKAEKCNKSTYPNNVFIARWSTNDYPYAVFILWDWFFVSRECECFGEAHSWSGSSLNVRQGRNLTGWAREVWDWIRWGYRILAVYVIASLKGTTLVMSSLTSLHTQIVSSFPHLRNVSYMDVELGAVWGTQRSIVCRHLD